MDNQCIKMLMHFALSKVRMKKKSAKKQPRTFCKNRPKFKPFLSGTIYINDLTGWNVNSKTCNPTLVQQTHLGLTHLSETSFDNNV